MKVVVSAIWLALVMGSAAAFVPTLSFNTKTGSSLSMVLEKPKVKKIAKIESLKVESDHLLYPLKEVRSLARIGLSLWQVRYLLFLCRDASK